MSQADLKKISKFLSLVLRHDPAAAGIELDIQGWANVEALLAGAAQSCPMTREQLLEVVSTSDKKRFALDENGLFIRAVQGHLIPVDLSLSPITPPEILYHGTAEQTAPAILAQGLKPGLRQ